MRGWALLLLVAPGCTADLGLPAGARVACAPDRPCPEGFVCNPAGRCEPTDALDRTPPGLAGPAVVTPESGTIGTRLEVAFEVTEPLAWPPEVTVDLGTRRGPLEVEAGEGDRWVASWTASGAEPEGRQEVSILLVDASGNEARDTSAALVFDFTSPQLLAPVLDRDALSDGEGAVLDFLVSEPFPEERPPEVRLEHGRSWTPMAGGEGGGYRYAFQALEAEDVQGEARVLVTLEDGAGNRAEDLEAGLLDLDFTPPRVLAQSVGPPAVREGAAWTVSLRVDRPLAAPPALTTARGPATLAAGQPEQEGLSYRWTREVGPADVEGSYGLAAELTDRAGNDSRVELDGELRIDRTPPRVEAGSVSVAPDRLFRTGEDLELSLSTSEPLATPPAVFLKAQRLPEPRAVEDGGRRWSWTHRVQGLPGEDGVFGLVVELEDPAGNRLTDSQSLGEVTLDFTPPQAWATVDPNPAGGHAAVRLGLNVDGPLAEGVPLLEVRRLGEDAWHPFGGRAEPRGAGWTFVRDVVPAEGELSPLREGRYTFRVSLTDLAGNVAPEVKLDPVLEVDLRAPRVVADDAAVVASCDHPVRPEERLVTGRHARAGSLVEIRFSLDEPPAEGTLLVRVGPEEVAAGEDEDGAWLLRHLVGPPGAEEGQRQVPVTVQLQDAAGNATSRTLDTLTLDDVPPRLVGTPFFQRDDLYAPAHVEANLVHARAGDRVLVSFAADEPTGLPPRLLVAGEVFLPARWQRDDRTFEVTVAHPGARGEQDVEVIVTDLAGNASRPLPLGAIVFDDEPPPPPATEGDGVLVYRRVPWGSHDTGGESRFTVSGGPGAAEAFATVRVFDGPDEAAAELGWGSADGAGEVRPFVLVRSDHPMVYVAAGDRAGNRSPSVPIRHGEWVATLAHRVPGRSLDNPHSLHVGGAAGPALSAPGAVEAAGEAVARADGEVLVTRGSGAWAPAHVPGISVPSARASHSLVYDSARDRLVLFGGDDDEDDLWERDGDGRVWTLVCGTGTSCSGPPAGEAHRLVYDSVRGKVVLLEGEAQGVWEWDGGHHTWEKVCGAGTVCQGGPSGASSTAVAFDASRGRLVVIGYERHFEWDGRTRTWTRMRVAPPDPLDRHVLTWDPARERLLLLAKAVEESADASLWEYDGRARAWQEVCNPTRGCPIPAENLDPTLVHAPDLGRTLLFVRGPDEARVLEWDAEAGRWEHACGPGTPCQGPPEHDAPAVGYDPRRGLLVVHGGSEPPTDEVREYDVRARTWRTAQGRGVSGPVLPGWRGLAFDAARGRAVLHGAAEFYEPAETWEWDSSIELWTRVCGAGTGCAPPPAVGGRGLVWDPDLGRTLLFGLGETWAWDGDRWEQLCGPGPPCDNPRHYGTRRVAWDPVRRRAGGGAGRGGGRGVGGARDFDAVAGSWSDRCVPGLGCLFDGARPGFALAHVHQEGRGHLLLLGGESQADGDRLNDLLAWDDDRTRWDRVFGGNPEVDPGPPARVDHDLAYDPVRGTVVLFGGDALHTAPNTWEWSPVGQAWSLTCAPPGCRAPAEREGHDLVWDAAAGRVLLHGGGWDEDDSWVWTHAANRPYQRFTLPRFELWPEDVAVIDSLTVRARTGATGDAAGRPLSGVRLLVWDRGAWRALAENAAPADAPDALAWSSRDPLSPAAADPELLRRLFELSDERVLALALEPVADNGSGVAELATDYLEVEVEYTRQPPSCTLGEDLLCRDGACYPDEAWEEGVCLPAGGQAEGEPCESHEDCRAGHACHAGGDEPAACVPVCDGVDRSPGCPEGAYCLPVGVRVGLCVPDAGCGNAEEVARACEAGVRDNCTCGPDDPCRWGGDGTCEAWCRLAFPDAHLEEGDDCGDCASDEEVAFSCVREWVYDCTCAPGDPCGWAGDGHCNEECYARFPGAHFDDGEDCRRE